MRSGGQFAHSRDRSRGRCLHPILSRVSNMGVSVSGFVWCHPEMRPEWGSPSAPGEDVSSYYKISASPNSAILGAWRQYHVFWGGLRSLVLVAEIPPCHCPGHNFSEERGKHEVRLLSTGPSLGSGLPARLQGFLAYHISEIVWRRCGQLHPDR